jgi:hypothetical protein
MQNKNKKKTRKDGIIHSERFTAKLSSTDLQFALDEMFDKVVTGQLFPYVGKMIRENKFLSVRAFGDWDNGIDTFHLEIFGGEMPDYVDFQNPRDIVQDADHYEQNLRDGNAEIVPMILNTIAGMTITGAPRGFVADFYVGIDEFNYLFRVVWTYEPFSERGAQIRMNN